MLSDPLQMNLVINIPGYINEYKFIFEKNLIIDETIAVNFSLSKMKLFINHEEYNFLFKCLMQNIIFDDGLNKYLIHDYEI